MFYYALICKTIELGVLCFYHDCILASVVIMTLSEPVESQAYSEAIAAHKTSWKIKDFHF